MRIWQYNKGVVGWRQEWFVEHRVVSIKGRDVIISPQDYNIVVSKKWQWAGSRRAYLYHHYREAGKRKCIMLHRLILNAPKGVCVDHKDGNTFNNTRENLRLCSQSQNLQNRRARQNTHLKGITFRRDRNRWRARIKYNGKELYLGYYRTQEEAHAAYLEAARKYYGEFAHEWVYPNRRCG